MQELRRGRSESMVNAKALSLFIYPRCSVGASVKRVTILNNYGVLIIRWMNRTRESYQAIRESAYNIQQNRFQKSPERRLLWW